MRTISPLETIILIFIALVVILFVYLFFRKGDPFFEAIGIALICAGILLVIGLFLFAIIWRSILQYIHLDNLPGLEQKINERVGNLDPQIEICNNQKKKPE